MRGPLAISRESRTRVLAATAPTKAQPGRLAGKADIGTATTGRVSWQVALHPSGGSQVTLAAVVQRASLLDRALLALGGRWWLQRMFEQTLDNLDRILVGPTGLRG